MREHVHIKEFTCERTLVLMGPSMSEPDSERGKEARGGMSGREMQGERTKRFVLPQIAPSVAAGTYEPCTFDYELALPDADKARELAESSEELPR